MSCFFLEAFHATGDQGFLEDARIGANYLLSTLDKEKGAGLYVGVSGIGYCLEETYKATKEWQYRQGVVRCLDNLKEWAEEKEKGIQWSETSDIISGNAGTGLLHLEEFESGKQPQIVLPDNPFLRGDEKK